MSPGGPTLTCRGAILWEPGRPLVVAEALEVPPPGPGQVRVRVSHAGVCRSQLLEARGQRGRDPHLPHLLGHEGTGTVVDVGPGVTRVAPGDRVVLTWLRCRGADPPGACYRYRGTAIRSGRVTTWSDLTVVAESRCVPCPPGLPPEITPLFGCALLTGSGLVRNLLRPRPGQSLAVFGLGGVGLSALLAARLAGCRPLIGVDPEPGKRELARALGATHVLDPAAGPIAEQIEAVTGSRGLDFAAEATGSARGIEAAFRSVRPRGGVCAFASHPPHGEHLEIDPFLLLEGRRLLGTWGGDGDAEREIPELAELYTGAGLPLERLVTAPYPLSAINEALADLEAGRIPRALLRLSGDPAPARADGA